MKSGAKFNWTRRNFLKTGLLALVAIPLVQSCKKTVEKLIFKITGTNHILGHRLRTGDFPKPSKTINENIVIIGGGISGLSAARWLSKNNILDFKLIEMETELGGNSLGKQNQYSKYPVAAHYLPLPNHSNKNLFDFLHESNIITGFSEDGTPIYDESQLCFTPHDRLFIHNYWQEGIIPNYGLSEDDHKSFKIFDEKMQFYKDAKGKDGAYAFDIPLHQSSNDDEFTKLDQLTFKDWLLANNLNNSELFTYLNYCCKDDYGIGIDKVSAWAGIHYFCSRKDTQNEVLTWPEGNYFIAKKFLPYTENKTNKNVLVYSVKTAENKVELLVYDDRLKTSTKIIANKVILATPQFVNKYILENRNEISKKFEYAPWITATLALNKFPIGEGAPLSWDNVIHNGFGLGYIYNQHQMLNQYQTPFSITYYAALCTDNLKSERKRLLSNTDDYWKKIVLNDLEKAHYNISAEVISLELHKKGHGMISPFSNFIFSEEIKQAAQPIENKIYFAHSDLSGISIFEEAFCQGIKAAKELINDTALDT